MPVEIRELVIKTTLESRPNTDPTAQPSVMTEAMRRDILEQCERMIRDSQPKTLLER